MKLSIEIRDAEELAIINAAASTIVKHRAQRAEEWNAWFGFPFDANNETTPGTATEEIAQAVEDASTAESPDTLIVAQSTDTLTPAPLVIDANDRVTNVKIVEVPGAVLPVAVIETPPPAEATEADAVAAVTAATQRGVGMAAIIAWLGRNKVKKVPELSPAQRTEFVAWLGKQAVGAA